MELSGLELLLDVLHSFKGEMLRPLRRNTMGLLTNIAEVKALRTRLMTPAMMHELKSVEGKEGGGEGGMRVRSSQTLTESRTLVVPAQGLLDRDERA